ncbi:MAG: F0F1 ATP synthase subunit epsilon [Lewinellaceae bacterium]|nr:F0F1 ATP synthase subunit epsilon [Phaeodactylibacter sp.]MCB9041998.1 F0F1 ATP synthase subunit epsilon [Lewinellaceae bacterium]
MDPELMQLKILLPFKVFADVDNVKRIVVETAQGSFGLLPNRLDGTAALVPGILCYETEAGGEAFLAVDEGVLVKAGREVLVSVRHAIGGAELGKLREAVEEAFLRKGEQEKALRTTLAKLESDFIRRLAKFHRKE